VAGLWLATMPTHAWAEGRTHGPEVAIGDRVTDKIIALPHECARHPALRAKAAAIFREIAGS
jgi:hypothetical protein